MCLSINGRIARALTEMVLAKSENTPFRFYNMSAQDILDLLLPGVVRLRYKEILYLTVQYLLCFRLISLLQQ